MIEEEDKHIFARCLVCENAENILKKYPNEKPRKFLVCADGIYAICCECSYRIEIPQLKKVNKKRK